MRSLTLTQSVSLNASASQAAVNLLGASDINPPIYMGQAVVNVTATNASPAVFTITAGQVLNGLQNGLPVQLGILNGGTITPPFVAATEANQQTYYTVGVSGSTFQLAATVGGAAINSTGTGTSVYANFLNVNEGVGAAISYSQGAQFNVSCPIASPGVFTGGYIPNGTAVVLSAQINPATGQPYTTAVVPTGFVYGTQYFVVNANQTAGTFQLSATVGGSGINATGAAVQTQVTALIATATYSVAGPGSPFLPSYSGVLYLSSTASAATTSFIVEGAQDTMNPPGTPGVYSTIASIVGISSGGVAVEVKNFPQYIRTRVVNGGADTGAGSAFLLGT